MPESIWQIDILPAYGQRDVTGESLHSEAADLGLSDNVTLAAAHGFLLQGELSEADIQRAAQLLLADSIVESTTIAPIGDRRLGQPRGQLRQLVHVLLKPGVMDPVALSTLQALQDMSLPVRQVPPIANTG